MMRLMRKIHKWLGLLTLVIVVMIAVTGMLLVHRKSLSLNTLMVQAPGYATTAPLDAHELLLGDGVALVASKRGVFMSTDRGWKLTLARQTRRLYLKSRKVYACSKDGLYESADGGASWVNLFSGDER